MSAGTCVRMSVELTSPGAELRRFAMSDRYTVSDESHDRVPAVLELELSDGSTVVAEARRTGPDEWQFAADVPVGASIVLISIEWDDQATSGIYLPAHESPSPGSP